MKPSNKSQEIENTLNDMFGFDRRTIIIKNHCIPPPYGCGKPIGEFRDELSRKEYTISGMCQSCQDELFGK